MSLVRRLAANDSVDRHPRDGRRLDGRVRDREVDPARARIPRRARSSGRILPDRCRPRRGRHRLWAIPINSNTELLWYRKDLVPTPPKTWTQMISEADQLAKQGKPHYIEEQGAQYEGLTVWFNSLVDSAGGQILTANNKVVLGSAAKKAAAIMHELATSPAADPSLNVSHGGPRPTSRSRTATRRSRSITRSSGSRPRRPNPKVAKEMGYALLPAGHAGHRAARLDRRLQPRHLGPLQAPEARLRRGPVPDPAGQPEPDAIKGGLAPVAASIYDQPAFDKAYPFHQLIKQPAADLRPPPADARPTRTSRWRSRRRCRRPRASTRTPWSAHCVTRSSCRCPHRALL